VVSVGRAIAAADVVVLAVPAHALLPTARAFGSELRGKARAAPAVGAHGSPWALNPEWAPVAVFVRHLPHRPLSPLPPPPPHAHARAPRCLARPPALCPPPAQIVVDVTNPTASDLARMASDTAEAAPALVKVLPSAAGSSSSSNDLEACPNDVGSPACAWSGGARALAPALQCCRQHWATEMRKARQVRQGPPAAAARRTSTFSRIATHTAARPQT
jgi:hypothetical protein